MRTTVDLEIDVHESVRERARKEKTTIGRILSDEYRNSMNSKGPKSRKSTGSSNDIFVLKNGIPVLPPRPGKIITSEHIRKLMDEEGI